MATLKRHRFPSGTLSQLPDLACSYERLKLLTNAEKTGQVNRSQSS